MTMTTDNRPKRLDAREMMALYRAFSREESGMVTVFALFMIFCMSLMAGIGLDMMRHETNRAQIQQVSDRAVLAAADLDQTLDPEAVVRDYFAKSGMSDFVSNVNVDEGINYRTVTVEAETNMNTMFMDFLGRETLRVPALSTATERIEKVEISMVLDISGSMGWNNKMPNLRNAANVFLDTVLTEDNRGLISVSLAPYTAQTNAGPHIFDLLNVDQTHDWSYCVDFEDTDFDTTAIYFGSPLNPTPYEHMQHFDAGWGWPGWHNGEDTITNPGCPKQEFETVYAFSQDKQALKDRINQFQARANTAIHLGMKWGVALLDPEWRKFNAVLPTAAGVDPAFRNRPDDFRDPSNPTSMETVKTIILMTDGENVHTQRIADRYYAQYSHWLHWSKYPLNGYLNRYVYSNDHWRWRYTKYTPTQADGLLDRICDAAKDKGIIIWTIAFEAPPRGEEVMRDCASSQAHYFSVDGTEITDAFESIARSINKLRLTQ
ncbi:MAG: Tad domain-containing protein [Pseudomonadota bacterium]